MGRKETLISAAPRFWQKVSKDPMSSLGRKHGCWEWTASVTPYGYGKLFTHAVKVGDRKVSKFVTAHRYSWMLHNKVWELPERAPDGGRTEILHLCDNPRCVRPTHLKKGSSADNMRDKASKGRHHLQKRKTCQKGHAWTKKNTGWIRGHKSKVDGTPWQVRYCKACHSKRMKAQWEKSERAKRQDPAYKARKNARRRELYALRKENKQ